MLFLYVFVLSALAVAACNEIELIRWRRSAGAHWTERARRHFPARVARSTNLFFIPLTLCYLAWGLIPGTTNHWQFVAGILGGVLGNYPFDRALLPGLSFRDWAHRACGTLVLHTSGLVLFALALGFMPSRPGPLMAVVAGAYLIAHFSLQFNLVRLGRALRVIRPAPPRVQELVAAASAALGVTVRGVWELAYLDVNAFAIVTTKDIGFSSRLIAEFSDDEIKVIAAHELGHLSESRWTQAGRLLTSLGFLPVIFVGPALTLWSLKGLLVVVVAALLILALGARLSQAMEKRADRVARQTETEAAAYARTLEHLHRVNHTPAVLHKRATVSHPDLYDRMIAAGLTPDYPRPAPPPRSWTGTVMFIAFFAAVIFYSLETTPPRKPGRPAPQEEAPSVNR